MKRVGEVAPPSTTPSTEPDRVVLYVEDEQANWEVTELRLRKKFKLVWARSSKEACDAVREYKGQFYAVLMDIQLKGSELDGMALTRLFRGKPIEGFVPAYAAGLPHVDCPLFFVTAYGSLHSPAQMVQAGGDDYVPKPVDFIKLSNLLVSVHARRAMSTLQG